MGIRKWHAEQRSFHKHVLEMRILCRLSCKSFTETLVQEEKRLLFIESRTAQKYSYVHGIKLTSIH